MPASGPNVTLVLSGGNALGSYQGGAFQALQERALEPNWIIGASIGAVNGAIICGNSPQERVERLKRFWKVDESLDDRHDASPSYEDARRSGAAAETLAFGQSGLFVPHHLAPFRNPFVRGEPSGLFDSRQLEFTLERLVDFEMLNQGSPRFTATAVNIESGMEIMFDTNKEALGPRHLRASTAFMPAFAPVEIDDQLYGDGGIAANLPLDLALAEEGEQPLLCIAIDLLPLAGKRPATISETTNRVQDLLFASQSRRAIAAWQAIFGASLKPPSVTLLHLVYSSQHREVAGKAMDYSMPTSRSRWKSGYDDLTTALVQLEADPSLLGRPGLTVYQLTAPEHGRRLDPVQCSLRPYSPEMPRQPNTPHDRS